MYGNKGSILSKFPKGTCKGTVVIKHYINGPTGAEVVFIWESIRPTKHMSAACCGITTAHVKFKHAFNARYKITSLSENKRSATLANTLAGTHLRGIHHVEVSDKAVPSSMVTTPFYPFLGFFLFIQIRK